MYVAVVFRAEPGLIPCLLQKPLQLLIIHKYKLLSIVPRFNQRMRYIMRSSHYADEQLLANIFPKTWGQDINEKSAMDAIALGAEHQPASQLAPSLLPQLAHDAQIHNETTRKIQCTPSNHGTENT